MKTATKLDSYYNETEEPPGALLLQPVSPFAHHESRLPRLSYDESLRFYQHLCPPFTHEPTRDKFAVVTTDAVGEGLIALVDFAPGDIVFTFAGTVLPHQTLFTLQIEAGKYLEDPQVMGKVLHSCDPNMVCSMEHLTFWAVKPIRANDYLFMDYETTEDKLFRQFECCCGAQDCRGQVRGRAFLTPQRRKLARTIADYRQHAETL